MYFFFAAGFAMNFSETTVAFWHLVGFSLCKIASLILLHALLHFLVFFKALMQAGTFFVIVAADVAPQSVINAVLASATELA
jgi:hypothetical protein